jgi:two-component system sensor histidine kinase PilS (NtrC family)
MWWLIGGRAAVALLALVIEIVSATRTAGTQSEALFSGNAIFVIFTALALSIIYAFLLRFSTVARQRQTAAQFACDVLLISWLVVTTGDFRSPYVALYIVVISLASLFQGARGALLLSAFAGICYTTMMVGGVYDPTASTPGERTLNAESAQVIGFNVVAFLIVGLLAARLAARQSGEQAATHALVNLRALHERIVESMRSGVVTLDLERRIFTFNSAAEEITGYTANELRGRDAAMLFGALDARITESLRAAAAAEKSPRYETDCPTPDDLSVRLGFSIFPLYPEAGDDVNPTGVVITFQDLTEVRALEETARRQDRLAAVGRMAAGIAHEIRNPLASISGSVQVLRAEANGDEGQIELMDIILRESERLNRIITDYLTYARPRSGAYTEIDLRLALRETIALTRYSPEFTANHKIEERLPDAPVLAMADFDRLKQVFSNLVRNSLQAMPDGGSITIETGVLPNARSRIIFTDTGCGMTPKQVEQLFEPFTSTKPSGTGLGLSIVYQIVRDHGGTINVQSREGAGTTITIELPGAQHDTPALVRTRFNDEQREGEL